MNEYTVLVVDDDSSACDTLVRILGQEPFQPIAAASANEGWEVLERYPVDAVISDHEMPGMRGTEFLHKVSKLYPDTVRFMLTGKATLDVAIDAINNGAIARFFVKPCDATDLIVSLRDALLQRDLIVEMRKLLSRSKQHEALLRKLETIHPGITQLDRDDEGAIVIKESPLSLEELIEESRKIRAS